MLSSKRLLTVLVSALSLYVPSVFSAVIYIADDVGAVAAYDDVSMLLAPVGNVSDTFTVSQNIGIAYDAANSRILLLDRGAPMVYAMDPSNGNVTQLFDPGIEFQGGAVKNNTLYGVDESTQELVAFDLTAFTPVAIAGGAIPGHTHGTGIDPASGQLYVAGSSVYPIADDGTAGAALFALQTAAEDLDYYGGDFLVVDYGRNVLHYDNVGTETEFLTDAQLAAAGVASNVSGVVIGSGEVVPVASNARFHVTKAFSDGRTDEVDVTLTCNTGLPLQQDFTIEGGDPGGVVFVVTEFEEGAMDCEVTESGSPSGYTPVFNGGAGCEFADVTSGVYECAITNEANDATFTVTKEWVVEGAVGEEVQEEASVSIYCNNEIDGGYWNGSEYQYNAFLSGDGDFVTVSIDTTAQSAQCRAEEAIFQSGVESENDCGTRTIPAGGSSSCTITNTVFFEGIPTLSQWGMAIMALLMLGIGFVGLRRIA